MLLFKIRFDTQNITRTETFFIRITVNIFYNKKKINFLKCNTESVIVTQIFEAIKETIPRYVIFSHLWPINIGSKILGQCLKYGFIKVVFQ